jgi:hypothetical protein
VILLEEITQWTQEGRGKTVGVIAKLARKDEIILLKEIARWARRKR